MRSFRVWVAAWAVLGVHGVAHAQPQDDAALAEVPNENAPTSTSPLGFGSPARPSDAEGEAKPKEEDESESAVTTAELVEGYPDVQFRAFPPPKLTVFLTSIYPFQVFGVGLGLDVYVLPSLRLSVAGTAGISVSGDTKVEDYAHASFYGEAGVGFTVARFASETTAKLPVLSPRFRVHRDKSSVPSRSGLTRFMLGDPEPSDDQLVRAIVPAFHSIELEAGLFSGLYPLYRCTASCDQNPALVQHTNEDASLQVALVYAGVRYVYFRWARSEQAPFRSRAGVEAAIDLIHNPFTVRDADLFNINDHHPSHDPVGFRVKFSVLGIKCLATGPCLGLDLMAGYLPTPADGMFSANFVVQ